MKRVNRALIFPLCLIAVTLWLTPDGFARGRGGGAVAAGVERVAVGRVVPLQVDRPR